MKPALFGMLALALSGCGVEVATTAATSAAIKKQELETGKQTKDRLDKEIGEAVQAMQQRHADK